MNFHSTNQRDRETSTSKMNLVIFACVTIIITLLLRIYFKTKYKRFYKLIEQFPSHPTSPLIGNLKASYATVKDFRRNVMDLMKSHDRLIFWIGPIPILLLKRADDVSFILSQCDNREMHELGKQWAGVGVLTGSYEEWKKSRKLILPAFSAKMLSKYVETFITKSSNLVDRFKPMADTGEVVNISDHALTINIETMLENVLDVSPEEAGKAGEEFGHLTAKVFEFIIDRMLKPWLYPHCFYNLYLKLTGKMKLVEAFHYLPTKMLKERTAEFKARKEQSDFVDSPKTIINLIISENQREDTRFNEERLKGELLQMIAAGFETSSLSLSTILLMLALHQDAQEKVYEEILRDLQGETKITAHHVMNKFKYLEQCFRETVRMYSPIVLTLRQTYKEHVLRDNTIIPSGLCVVPLIHLAQRDGDLYENPDKWDPDHYSDEAILKRPKGKETAFGNGVRYCLGSKYVTFSIKSQVAHVILNYRLTSNIKELKPEDLRMDFSIRSAIGYPIIFHSRQKTAQM
uniref:Cytochrome P450 4461N1 n=1 Tax=Maconellicoccus hirsutus TaxID=177089 RepID=A0AAT9UTY2_MACHI